MNRILVYALIGRICIFLLQKFPFHKLPIVGKYAKEGGFLYDLLACDLCLGVWVYVFFSAIFRLNLLDSYIPVMSELVTGGTISFIVWLAVRGYQSQFSIIEVK